MTLQRQQCYPAQTLVWTLQRQNDLKPVNIKAGTRAAAVSSPVKLPLLLSHLGLKVTVVLGLEV